VLVELEFALCIHRLLGLCAEHGLRIGDTLHSPASEILAVLRKSSSGFRPATVPHAALQASMPLVEQPSGVC
jgi:hypothetical protein